MIILGIETSCDETACAVVKQEGDRVEILSNVIASSQQIHIKYGGIVPENAAREQLKSIVPVISEAINQAFPNSPISEIRDLISGIAVTQGPGLIGSLLVGVETAKTLSLVWQKPLIPVNHLLAHFYANFITDTPVFPAIGLLASGGHTDLILITGHRVYEYLGGTRDDAAGECFDKCARLLSLPYPGGPNLAKLAETGDPTQFKLPLPMQDSDDLDFSFSGLKTAVANIVNSSQFMVHGKTDLAAAIEQTIINHLIAKTKLAVRQFKVDQLLVAGGVAANQTLADSLKCQLQGVRVFIPPPRLCTDNAVTTAVYACFNYRPVDPLTLQADPNLSLRK